MTAEACSRGAHSATRRLTDGIARATGRQRGGVPKRVTGLLLGVLVAAATAGHAESPASSAVTTQPVDVVFVLDNSGSMRTNDPDFLTRRAVEKFAAALAEDATIDGRIALVLFDDQATLVQPLIAVDRLVSENRLAGTLAALDFSGQRTNSPAGIERALYELRERGREGARGAIVFLSDGRIDTGDARNDLELARWLREDLASESDESGIRIFGIAFTDGADYQLMQALARRTRARYYRAFAAEDLAGVVDDVLTTVDEPPVYDLAYLETPSALAPATASTEGRTAGGAASPASAAEDSSRSNRGPGLLGWLPVAVLLTGAGYLLARRRTSAGASGENAAPPAQLLDPGGMLGEAGHTLPLATGRTSIGRDPQNDIVLPDDTISSEHALIEVHDGRYWLVDLRSTNGTRHAGRRLAPDERVALKGGDHVRFADIDLMFVVEGYVPGGATVYLSSSTTPPSDWSVLASSTAAEPKPVRPPGEDEHASENGPAPDVAEDPDDELGARGVRDPSTERDAPSGEVVFAEQRERIDPASVVDLDDELGTPSDGDPDSARIAEPSRQDQAASEASVADALERAEAALAAIEPASPRSSAAIPLPRPSAESSAESSRPLALLPDPDPAPATEPEVLDPIDGPTAEVVPPRSDAAGAATAPGESDFDSSTTDSDPQSLACEGLRACLDYHLTRVADISPAFESFVDRAFDEELRSALPVAARDLLESAGESGRVEERAYTFDRIRYLICAVPTSMDGARDCFLETYGGFTRVLAEHLQAESFRTDRCEILALLTFGSAESPWVSLTIVPDEGQDPRIDLLSYEFLTESERSEIEPSLDAEISQSGLA